MLTPAFDLSQDDNFLIVSIRIPYAKVADAEVFFEKNDFRFYCKPYYLRLNLPGKVLYTEDPAAVYNADTGIMEIKMPKETPGEVFDDLDLLTKLLASKSQAGASVPTIEVIGDTNSTDAEDIDWEIDQPIEECDSVLLHEAKCGFANLYSCDIFRLKEETSEIFDIVDPEKKSPVRRTEERFRAEADYFSDDYYLDNLYNDEEILPLLSFKPEWDNLMLQASTVAEFRQFNKNVHFTAEEKDRLRSLPNKEYLLEKSEIKMALFGLVDILFAYAYNLRTTMGENTVESAWTINKISATLSCLETFPSLKAVAISSMRRSLCYPLYRHWKLTKTVLGDTIKILDLGQKYVLKCFLTIHKLFCHSEPRYILNNLYIMDYCVWIQGKSCKSQTLSTIAKALKKMQILKDDMDLDLNELEFGAELALHEYNTVNSNESSVKASNNQQSASEESSSCDTVTSSDSSSSDYTNTSDDSENE